jgi:hypothetical protein
MRMTLLTTGLACFVAAIVGGGLKAFGIEIPVIPSAKRQCLLAGVGVFLVVGSILLTKQATLTSIRHTNTASRTTSIGPVTVQSGAAVSFGQQGGQTAGTIINNVPPLVMTTSQQVVVSDKQGLIKTLITVVPNIPVSGPTSVAVDFDNPITAMDYDIAGYGGPLPGGDPSRIGRHALITVGTGFSPQHALLLTVYSVLPVKVIKPPILE